MGHKKSCCKGDTFEKLSVLFSFFLWIKIPIVYFLCGESKSANACFCFSGESSAVYNALSSWTSAL